MVYNPIGTLGVNPLNFLQEKNKALSRSNPLNKSFGKTENIEEKVPTNVPEPKGEDIAMNATAQTGRMMPDIAQAPNITFGGVDQSHAFKFPDLSVGLQKMSYILPKPENREQMIQKSQEYKEGQQEESARERANKLGELSQKEANFVKNMKKAGYGLDETIDFIEQKRKQLPEGGLSFGNPIVDFFGNLAKDAQKRFSNVVSDQKDRITNIGKGKSVVDRAVGLVLKPEEQATLYAMGQLAGLGGDTFVNFLSSATPDFAEKRGGEKIQQIVQDPTIQEGVKFAVENIDKYNDWAQQNPDAADLITSVVNIADVVPIGGATKKLSTEIAETALGKAVKEGLETTSTKIASQADKAMQAIPNIGTKPTASYEILSPNVAKMVSEPTSAKTIRAAITDPKKGTINYETRDGFAKFILGDKKGTLEPSEKAIISQKIIKEKIPEVSTNPKKFENPQTLYQQIDTTISNMSKDLSSEMQKIKRGSFEKELEEIDTALANQIYPDLEMQELRPSESKRIKKVIADLPEVKNVDDLWTLRKERDNAWSDRMKNNPNSAGYDVWMEGRKIINNGIEKVMQRADDSAKKVFSDMSALYTAQNNILLNAPDILKGEKGLFGKTSNVVRAGLSLAGVGRLLP